ncbi:MAG: M56 family metallopeptidase [Planctomycetota bacterium]|jgi:beta-lactamase regulating signal transducer with metallopeptidase domain
MTPENSQIADLLWSQLWQVTVLALVVGIVARFVSRRRPHLAYLLWMLVVIKCITPPLWSSPTGLFSWAQARGAVASASVPAADVVESVVPLPPADSTPPGESIPMRLPAENEGAIGTPAPGHREAATIVPWASLLLTAWLGGAAMLGLIVLAQRSRLLRLVKGSTFAADPCLVALASQVARDLGLRRRIHVVVTKEEITPAVFGVFRPTVLLPESLARGSSPEELRPLLAHELAHVRRWDCPAGVVQVFAQMVWWFHPLVWWANRRASQEREAPFK